MSKSPSKLMVVRNETKAAELRKVMGDDWMVVGVGAALSGRRFDVVLVVDQPLRDFEPEQWEKYVKTNLLTKLPPGGQLIEVY